jgi:hypothetical protein
MDTNKKTASQDSHPTQTNNEIQTKKMNPATDKNNYFFGGIKEFDLAQIESEVLNDNIYVDVFAGSDLALKTDIETTEPALSSIRKLDTIRYKWNDNIVKQQSIDSTTQLGVVAQQVAQEFPELVRRDSNTGFLTVNYTKLNVHLISAIKELADKCDQQETRIQALEKALLKN